MEDSVRGSGDGGGWGRRGIDVRLRLRPERTLIRPKGSFRHVDCEITVAHETSGDTLRRTPLALALVVDRSGSMNGSKLATAKQAALAVVGRLDERDKVAVVIFDDNIDVLQPAESVTGGVKAAIRKAFDHVEARGNTALHEGWLTGCKAIAGEARRGELARCFLLTDGLANVGLTDVEQVAFEAAGVRENAAVGTSTFGIGADYDEDLLAPLAVAGGGQFHHLRSEHEIAETFVGELGELLAVAARNLRLEIATGQRTRIEVVSAYRASEVNTTGWSIQVGDLMGGEERHVVLRLGFPAKGQQDGCVVRGRLLWNDQEGDKSGEWQDVAFSYADDSACNTEARNSAVMHWVGLQHANRAQREAAQLSKRGQTNDAVGMLRAAESRVAEYSGTDATLRDAMTDLSRMAKDIESGPFTAMQAKELTYQTQLRSRGQREHRGPVQPAREPNHYPAAELVRKYLLSRVEWPQPAPALLPADALPDLFRGCLVWGAVGDALGRPAEGRDPASLQRKYGPGGLQQFEPWPGWQSGPKGTITDDTQLTMEVARTMLAGGQRFDCGDFARRLIRWLPAGRGKGQATTQAVEALMRGEPWWEAALTIDSAGNGAAMRAAPTGLVRALAATPYKLRRDAVLSAWPTHTHPVGVGGAVVLAAGVAYCVRERLAGHRELDRLGLLEFVARTIDGTEPKPSMERKPGGKAVRLSERIRELGNLIERAPSQVFHYTYNGAFALESVPAALYAFLHTPDEPRQVILTAVNGGYDADTVASMAGNLAGAWCGAGRLRAEAPEWWQDLEFRDELIDLADRMVELALQQEGSDGDE